jgi:hypothetical protein
MNPCRSCKIEVTVLWDRPCSVDIFSKRRVSIRPFAVEADAGVNNIAKANRTTLAVWKRCLII